MRLRFRVSYDGSQYSGWQSQPNLRTIQDELNLALHKISELQSTVVGAGRTDAGVHATGQVAHCDVERNWSLVSFANAMNSHLPNSIFIQDVQIVPNDFHARFSATSRMYIYHCSYKYIPFRRTFEYFLEQECALTLLNACAKKILGKHNFETFIQQGADPNPICTIYSSYWEQQDHLLRYYIHADRFGWKMVRKLVSTFLMIGCGRYSMDLIDSMLQGVKETRIAPAPSHGLVLVGVTYPEFILGPEAPLAEWLTAF